MDVGLRIQKEALISAGWCTRLYRNQKMTDASNVSVSSSVNATTTEQTQKVWQGMCRQQAQ